MGKKLWLCCCLLLPPGLGNPVPRPIPDLGTCWCSAKNLTVPSQLPKCLLQAGLCPSGSVMALTKPSFFFLLSALLSESLVSSLLLDAAQLMIHSPEELQKNIPALSPAQKSGVNLQCCNRMWNLCVQNRRKMSLLSYQKPNLLLSFSS